ncbi:MAG: CHAD domain-containing protein [Hyphomicrobiales bacterium]|nr:CHAD domain-containing protein [Hyphomicrobiales bacterium]
MARSGSSGRSYEATPQDAPLVFAIDKQGLAKLRKSKVMVAGATADASIRRIKHVYYDTHDKRLARRGLSFNILHTDGRFVQTVTAGAADDAGATPIVSETEVSGLTPQMDAIAEPDVRDRLGFIAPGTLETVFTIDVQREQRLIEVRAGGQSSFISVAVDTGEITSECSGAPVAEPISEIQMELIKGSRLALFRLALDWLKAAPLVLHSNRRPERGLELSEGRPPPWVKSNVVRLDPSMTVEDAMSHIFSGCLTQITANQAAVLEGRDPEGVHQFRIAVRRLRSAFTTFGPLLAGQALDRLKDDARWVIQSLNAARDWDVFLTELLPPVVDGSDGASFTALEHGARAACAAGYDQARSMLHDDRYTRFMLELGLWVLERGWRREATAESIERLEASITGYASPLLSKRHKTALKRGKGFDEQTAEERHQVRIALKKLRYLLEFFEALFPSHKTKNYLSTLKSMQDDLGHLNDVATAERLVMALMDRSKADAPVEMAYASGRLIGWYAHGIQSSEVHARRDWKALKKSEPFW